MDRPLACDSCRRRKIRCDRLSPCYSCKASNIPCHTSRTTSGRRPRQYVIPYQRSIADLNQKIEKLSHALQPSSESPAERPAIESAMSPFASFRNDNIATRQRIIIDGDSCFQGDSSFVMHSKQATKALEASLASTPETPVDEALSGAIANLQETLDLSNAQSSSPGHPSNKDVDKTEPLSALPMPPSDLVLKLLRNAKGIFGVNVYQMRS